MLHLLPRHHLSLHGPHVVTRRTLCKRLRLPRRRRPVHNTLVRMLHLGCDVEQHGHQGGRKGEEDSRR